MGAPEAHWSFPVVARGPRRQGVGGALAAPAAARARRRLCVALPGARLRDAGAVPERLGWRRM
jgi:hypothetical protein